MLSTQIKLLALVEADRVTGPAKNMIEFCLAARQSQIRGSGIYVSLVTFHRRNAARGEREVSRDGFPNAFVRAARDAGIEIDVILERFRYDPRAMAELKNVVERRAPDLVETKSVKSHFFLRLSGIHRRIPWLAFHHGYTATDLKMLAYNQLDRWSLQEADQIVTVCSTFARHLAGHGIMPERISLVQNSISTTYGQGKGDETRQALRSAWAITADERVVLTVGRLSKEKAQVDLVVAFARLVQKHPEIKLRLVIVGEGPERRRIEETAVALKVDDRLTMAGATNDAAAWYRAADLFALPSVSEGSPNVLLEAMMMELPIAATGVGGVPDIVTTGENALLVAPRNPQAMAEALEKLVTDEEHARRLAARAREAAIRNHSPESRFFALSSLYGRMVSAKKGMTQRLYKNR